VGRLLSLRAVAGLLPVRSALAIEGEPAPPDRWFGRIATLAAIYHSSATIATLPACSPGRRVTLDNNVTVGFDASATTSKRTSPRRWRWDPAEADDHG
jgi:hypothetical protein